MLEFYGPGSSIARSGDLRQRLSILAKGVSRVNGVTTTSSNPDILPVGKPWIRPEDDVPATGMPVVVGRLAPLRLAIRGVASTDICRDIDV